MSSVLCVRCSSRPATECGQLCYWCHEGKAPEQRQHHTKLTTSALWSAAHTALCEGRWVDARPMLETLARRSDARDYLCRVGVYTQIRLTNVPSDAMVQVISDRIDAVNARVERNRFDRVAALAAL